MDGPGSAAVLCRWDNLLGRFSAPLFFFPGLLELGLLRVPSATLWPHPSSFLFVFPRGASEHRMIIWIFNVLVTLPFLLPCQHLWLHISSIYPITFPQWQHLVIQYGGKRTDLAQRLFPVPELFSWAGSLPVSSSSLPELPCWEPRLFPLQQSGRIPPPFFSSFHMEHLSTGWSCEYLLVWPLYLNLDPPQDLTVDPPLKWPD